MGVQAPRASRGHRPSHRVTPYQGHPTLARKAPRVPPVTPRPPSPPRRTRHRDPQTCCAGGRVCGDLPCVEVPKPRFRGLTCISQSHLLPPQPTARPGASCPHHGSRVTQKTGGCFSHQPSGTAAAVTCPGLAQVASGETRWGGRSCWSFHLRGSCQAGGTFSCRPDTSP